MTRSRSIALRMLSPLFVTGLGVLVSAGCPLPKQIDDDQTRSCDDGGMCGPNDPNCRADRRAGDCDPQDPECSDGVCDPMKHGRPRLSARAPGRSVSQRLRRPANCECDPNTPGCSDGLCNPMLPDDPDCCARERSDVQRRPVQRRSGRSRLRLSARRPELPRQRLRSERPERSGLQDAVCRPTPTATRVSSASTGSVSAATRTTRCAATGFATRCCRTTPTAARPTIRCAATVLQRRSGRPRLRLPARRPELPGQRPATR
jgi:hypothetical protein